MTRKLLLTAAVAAALGTAGVVWATVDFPDIAENISASEDRGPLVFDGATIETTLGFGVAEGAERFIRIALRDGQEFRRNVTPTDLVIPGANVSVALRGTTDDSDVVFSVEATSELEPGTAVTFSLDTIAVAGKPDEFTIDYQISEFAGGLDPEFTRELTTSLGYKSPIGTLGAAPAQSPRQIDRSTGSTSFTGAVSGAAFIGTFTLVPASVKGFTTDGSSFDVTEQAGGGGATAADDFGAVFEESTIKIRGNFAGISAIRLFTDAACSDGLDISLDDSEDGNVTTVNGTQEFTAAVPNSGHGLAAGEGGICIVADGGTAMVASDYEIRWAGTGTSFSPGFDNASLAPTALATIRRNVSEDTIPFATGIDAQFFRISNPTSEAGNVYLTIFNPAGEKCEFDLDELVDRNGNTLSNPLGANASTPLFTASQFDALCPDGTFIQNLRVKVEGEFGDTGATTGEGAATGIRIDAFNTSNFQINR